MNAYFNFVRIVCDLALDYTDLMSKNTQVASKLIILTKNSAKIRKIFIMKYKSKTYAEKKYQHDKLDAC